MVSGFYVIERNPFLNPSLQKNSIMVSCSICMILFHTVEYLVRWSMHSGDESEGADCILFFSEWPPLGTAGPAPRDLESASLCRPPPAPVVHPQPSLPTPACGVGSAVHAAGPPFITHLF